MIAPLPPGEAMPPDAGESEGARHAALLLYAMAERDRRWLLAALPAGQRTELQSLLAELDSLGITREPYLVDDLLDSAGHVVPTSRAGDPVAQATPVSDQDALGRLGAHQIQQLAQRLRGEPAGLVAQLLEVDAWPWRDRVLDALEPDHRQQVQAITDVAAGSVLPRALCDALVGALTLDLRESPRPAPPRPRPWLARWFPASRSRRGDAA